MPYQPFWLVQEVKRLHGPLPMGRETRSPRLAEVLAHWALIIESGRWEVDMNGVAEVGDWFDCHLTQSQLNWRDQIVQ